MKLRAGTRAWLDVAYTERTLANRLGAIYDPAAKSWYAPAPGLAAPGGALSRWARLPEDIPGEDRGYGRGLYADPIPQACWYQNLRSALSETDWHRVSMMVRRRVGWRCEACGTPMRPEQRHLLDAHERFAYDDRARTQRLVRLICLCAACHGATHYGFARATGDEPAVKRQLQAVTDMNDHELRVHLEQAFATCRRRAAVAWTTDLSVIAGAGLNVRGAEVDAKGHAVPWHERSPGWTPAPVTEAADETPTTEASQWMRGVLDLFR